MTPTLSWVPVLRIDLNFISHSNRDFIHIFIPGLPHLNSYELFFPKFPPQNKLLKMFPKKNPKKFPEVSNQKSLPKFPQLWLQFHPQKTQVFFRLAWPTWSRRPWLWRNLQARPDRSVGRTSEWVDLCNKKQKPWEKWEVFFFFEFLCVARRSFFWKLGRGLLFRG